MERLDKVLVERGFVESREKAKALIMAGLVFVDGKRVDKPGIKVKEDASLEVKELPKYVSRGGYKLESALRGFNLDIRGFTVIDVGASTGGFTDCLLQHGAKKVYAVDVGRGQLHPKLRQDPRVVVLEKTDARDLSKDLIPEKVDLITVDVSFISITKVLPSVLPFLKERGQLLGLIKPQFELCPREVKKGIVRDRNMKKKALLKVCRFIKEDLKMKVLGLRKAFPKGTKGNEEFFVLASKEGQNIDLEVAVEEALDQTEGI